MFKREAPDVSRTWTESTEEEKEAGMLQAVSWRITNKMNILPPQGGKKTQKLQESLCTKGVTGFSFSLQS